MSNEEYEHPPDATGRQNLNVARATGETVDMVGKIDKGIAVLATVRKPGKGKLSLSEAIATIIEQATAYEQWCQFGSPVGVIEVWVEDKKVMTVQPGDLAELKGVLFEMASLPKSVVQVVRQADEITDTVVLLNRELREVSKGVKFVELHPNNQEVTLEVKPEGDGQLRLWLGFNPARATTVENPRRLERLKGKAAAARAAFHRQIQWLKSPWRIPAFGTAAATAVLSILVVSALLNRPQEAALGAVKAVDPALALDDIVASTIVGSSTSPVDVRGLSQDDAAVAVIDAKQETGTAQAKGQRAQKLRHRPRLKPIQVEVTAPQDEPLSADSSTVVSVTDSPEREGQYTAEASPWEAQRLRRLEEVHSVILLTSDSTQVNEAQSKELLASVSVALKGMGINVLTKEAEKNQADGIMLVRFEPDAIYFGAIFATMRDREGNFLWQEHAGCRALPDSRWSTMLEDASLRLVSKLPSRAKPTPQSVNVAEQSVASIE